MREQPVRTTNGLGALHVCVRRQNRVLHPLGLLEQRFLQAANRRIKLCARIHGPQARGRCNLIVARAARVQFRRDRTGFFMQEPVNHGMNIFVGWNGLRTGGNTCGNTLQSRIKCLAFLTREHTSVPQTQRPGARQSNVMRPQPKICRDGAIDCVQQRRWTARKSASPQLVRPVAFGGFRIGGDGVGVIAHDAGSNSGTGNCMQHRCIVAENEHCAEERGAATGGAATGGKWSGRAPKIIAEALGDAIAPLRGAANDEHRVVTCQRAKHVGPARRVERGADRLRARGHRFRDNHDVYTFNAHQQLRQQACQLRRIVLGDDFGKRVAGLATGIGNSGQPEFVKITRQRRLGHIPPAFVQLFSKIFLAGNIAGRDDVANGALTFTLIGHGVHSGRTRNLSGSENSLMADSPPSARASHRD